ncbi:MAG: biotin transporter BioY [Candidatus Adiutrix sp.]|nr:biotin transporter BioY [Candidatus Adiutrix sp.]
MFDKKNETPAAETVSLPEIKNLVRTVIWAALIGVGGWLSIPLPGVPVSLQTFFLVLAGIIEGPKTGAQAAGLYLLAGFLGLPIFAGGLGGPAILMSPSAGFALAFPLGAASAGWLARRPAEGVLTFRRALAAALLGLFVIFPLGLIGMIINTQMAPQAAALLLLNFVPGDLAKALAAASISSSRTFRRT